MKYNKRLVNKIVKLLVSDDYTQKEVCDLVGISCETFIQWKKTKPEFSEALEKANEERLETFKKEAKSGLLKLLKGTEYEEVTSEYKSHTDENGKNVPILKFQKRVKKYLAPNVTACIFTLKNVDPENFAEKSEVDHGIKGSFLDLLKQSSALKNDQEE